MYYGVVASDFSELFFGMKRSAVEKVTGGAVKDLKCRNGEIVTYLYDRGSTGCVGEGRCNPEKENMAQTLEIVGDFFTLGLVSYSFNDCISPCQKGYLQVYYNNQDKLIAISERPTERTGYCWNRGNKPHMSYPCTRIYEHRRSPTVNIELLHEGALTCDKFK